METLLQRLHRQRGDTSLPLLTGGGSTLVHAELVERVETLAAKLIDEHLRSVVLYADNGIDWVVADLACQHAGVVVTPLPLFFSAGQLAHAIACCGADALITDQTDGLIFQVCADAVAIGQSGARCGLYRLNQAVTVSLPPATGKITFTSGTTGEPKGVCLSAAQQLEVAAAIVAAIGAGQRRHLCVLPLSTLLENIAGVYAPLLAGGAVIAPSLAEVGLSGSSALDIGALLACIDRHGPNSLILVPEMLSALSAAAASGWRAPESLDFIAVGGSKVSPRLLEQARAVGLPVYEGYGLSECGSVVCLNVPGAGRAGSVGKPLRHAGVRIESNEIVVTQNVFLGYAGQPESWQPHEVRTGDLGRIDADGYVFIEGRASNQLITSFARNVSPEWVESELMAGPLLHQAVVFGDARPYCVALLYPRDTAATDADIDAWVKQTNQRLPDYARVADWRRLPEPLSAGNGTATENGRPRRDRVETGYFSAIDAMYEYQPEARSQ